MLRPLELARWPEEGTVTLPCEGEPFVAAACPAA
jgi:hypothetical protein